MLTREELEALAAVVGGGELFEAHRGAVRLTGGRSILAFVNDAYSTDPASPASVTAARNRLSGDGYILGPVTPLPPEDYTAVFEVVCPAEVELDEAQDAVESALWEAWAAAHDASPLLDGFCTLQRRIARRVTAGRVL
jgi:hypothetical protein